MSDLTFEERNRLESEVLPAVVDDPECAALTIVILEKQLAEARAERDARVPFEDCAKASWYAFSEGMIMSDPCVSNAQIKRAWPNSVASKRCNKIIREAAAQGGEWEEA